MNRTTIDCFNKNISLRVMMFMQYLMFAVWWVPLAAYLANMGIGANAKTWILSSMAIGSMASPILGALADRLFSAQKVLAVSNCITALLLIVAGFVETPTILFVVILLAMLCYMPTWSLVSTIAMRHTMPDQFPRIRLFGTIGWVASGLFSVVAYRLLEAEAFDGTSIPLFCGAGAALVAAALNRMLPDTPPAGVDRKISMRALLGFNAFSMLKDRNYLVFMVASVLAIIPFALYFSFGSEFLQDHDFKYITVTMNWGQLAEMLFLFIATAVIRYLGVKYAMIIGLVALLLRYILFYLGIITQQEALFIIAILLHGVIFGLFFVAGQVYTENRAPQALKAQAQGLLFFMVWGVGLLIGNMICGTIIKHAKEASSLEVAWKNSFMLVSGLSVIVLILFVIFFSPKKS